MGYDIFVVFLLCYFHAFYSKSKKAMTPARSGSVDAQKDDKSVISASGKTKVQGKISDFLKRSSRSIKQAGPEGGRESSADDDLPSTNDDIVSPVGSGRKRRRSPSLTDEPANKGSKRAKRAGSASSSSTTASVTLKKAKITPAKAKTR